MDRQTLDLIVITGIVAVPASGIVPALIETIRNTPIIHRQRLAEYEEPLNYSYDYEDPGAPNVTGSFLISARNTLHNYANFCPGPYSPSRANKE